MNQGSKNKISNCPEFKLCENTHDRPYRKLNMYVCWGLVLYIQTRIVVDVCSIIIY